MAEFALHVVKKICRLFAVLLVAAIATSQIHVQAYENANRSDSELEMNNPGSVVKRLENDSGQKEYFFQVPGFSKVMKPWQELKRDLDKDHGLKFGISYTAIYKKASDAFGPEDDAAGFDFDFSGSWTFLGRGTDSPTILGFNFFWRDTLGTDISPQTLFTQFGGLYSTDAPFGEEDPVIGELWIQHKFSNTFGFRVGKIFPITAYDFFPFKNFRTDFTDFNHVTNATIPLPGNGLGAFAVFRPAPKMMLRLGVHDANADVQKSGFDTYDDELFTIFETGFDIGLTPRQPGGPPSGHAHISVWHQDKRETKGIDDGWGIAGTLLQRFGRYTPFLRYGYADCEVNGPSSVEHMINVGLVIDNIFGQTNDRIGIGYTWSEPIDGSLDDQSMIDSYYRVQMTPQIEIGPTFQVVIDPVRYQDEDTVYVWGLRARISI